MRAYIKQETGISCVGYYMNRRHRDLDKWQRWYTRKAQRSAARQEMKRDLRQRMNEEEGSIHG